MSQLCFEWDPNKAETNRRKHGVTFEEAQSVFYDEFAGLIIDEKLGDDMVNEAEALVKKDIFTEGESADAGSVKLIQLEKAGSAMREADKIKDYLKNADDIISLLKADYRKR